jgi:saccharopine dehydrogenase-like NADP-dependent oxidoreductase
VSRPLVRYFLDRPGWRATVASVVEDEARLLVGDHPRGIACRADVADTARLDELVGAADVVVSLVPFPLHPAVARVAIARGVPMVTTSYVSPEMRALEGEARERGVPILNEIGLDPGIDHMSAMRMIDRVRSEGGTVLGFTSCCGSLPAPEAARGPWRYKFAWSPRGALLAARLPARWLDRGHVVTVPGEALAEHRVPCEIEGVGTFETYPNRDSLAYVETYGLDGVRTMLRATLRYPGWCETLAAVATLGLLDTGPTPVAPGTTWAELVARALPPEEGPIERRVAARLGIDPDHAIVERLRWAGLLSDEPVEPGATSSLDALAARLEAKLGYGPGERDMVILRHELEVGIGGATRRDVSLLVAHGEPGGDSATSRTVSLPAAIGARLLVEFRPLSPGVHVPTDAAIREPVLDELGALGIGLREWSASA